MHGLYFTFTLFSEGNTCIFITEHLHLQKNNFSQIFLILRNPGPVETRCDEKETIGEKEEGGRERERDKWRIRG